MKRPAIGTRITASDTLIRRVDHGARASWIRRGEIGKSIRPEPITGWFVGERTKFNGFCTWDGYEGRNYFVHQDSVTVWLITRHPRHDGVPVLPEDCKIITSEATQ